MSNYALGFVLLIDFWVGVLMSLAALSPKVLSCDAKVMAVSGCALQRTRSYWHGYCRLHMESSGCDLQKLQVHFHVILHQNKHGLLQCCLPSVYQLC